MTQLQSPRSWRFRGCSIDWSRGVTSPVIDLPRPVKWLGALTAGLLSIFFAEVCCGNEPLGLFFLDKIVLMFLVYGLHLLFLGSIVLRRLGNFASLYLAGCLFGLYEAYITHQLWIANNDEPMLFGVAVLKVVLLVFFWHALMAFVLPLIVCERYLLGGRQVWDSLSPKARRVLSNRWFIGALGLVAGAFSSTKLLPPQALLSAASAWGVLSIAFALYKRKAGGQRYELASIMPTGRPLVVIGFLLALEYTLAPFGFKLGWPPGLAAQATIWLFYGAIGGLLVISLRQRQPVPPPLEDEPPVRLRTDALRFFVPFVLASVLGSVTLKPLFVALYVSLCLLSFVVGPTLFVRAGLAVLRRTRQATTQPDWDKAGNPAG